ncbi:hypothetical protein K1719_001285 [Acacia pycnantha]|nr:hypothetical protein K1719_001285 [Acacia pycnantha]
MEISSLFLIYTIIIFLSSCFVLLSYHPSMKKRRKPQEQSAKLPPGSMGWPYVGETLQLYSQDPNRFFASKQKRYGEIFKTHILGCPCVMLASPEAARFVLVTHANLFKPTYPRSKEELIGPSALFFHQGDYHSRLRKLVQASLSPETIRKLVPDIVSTAISALHSWAAPPNNNQVINVFHEMKKFSFNIGILVVFGHLDSKYRDQLKENYTIVDKGYNSFPNSIPGTAYSKALLARKRINEIIGELISKWKEQRLIENNDLLGHMLKYKDEKGQALSDDQIADNIIGVLFAAQDTTASVLTWILKYLHDDQKLLEAVKTEQMAIYEANEQGKKPLTWTLTRNMPITYRVIQESLRMASIISFTFREAVEDVVYKGYLIPKGWKVMPLFRNIHHNPELFPAPHSFDLSRFEGIQYSPFPVPLHGLPARFWRN